MIIHDRKTTDGDSEDLSQFFESVFDPGFAVAGLIAEQERAALLIISIRRRSKSPTPGKGASDNACRFHSFIAHKVLAAVAAGSEMADSAQVLAAQASWRARDRIKPALGWQKETCY